MTNWEVFKDDDGKEWLKASREVAVDTPPGVAQPSNAKSTDQRGSAYIPLRPYTPGAFSAPYTLEAINAMKGVGFASRTATDSLMAFGQPNPIAQWAVADDVIEQRVDTGLIDQLRWPNSYSGSGSGKIVGGRPRPAEQPAGRFQNLDWEEAS